MKLSATAGLAFLVFFDFTLREAKAYIDEVKPSLEIFSGYKPMYFLLGYPDTKIQISFKAQILKKTPLFAAYTQRSYWLLFNKSSPFLDNAYNPEVFYRFPIDRDLSWLDVGLFEHESNGKDIDDSRSWNRAYLRYSTSRGEKDKPFLHGSAKVWFPYHYEENEDILTYRGLYELTLTYSNFLGSLFDRGDLSFTLYPGGKSKLVPWAGGQELTLRTNPSGLHLLHVFVLQIFHGTGENLIHYSESHWRVRLGVGF